MALEMLLDDIEDGLRNLGHLFLRKPDLLVNGLHNIDLRHGLHPPFSEIFIPLESPAIYGWDGLG
jgi:hypothetical protein